LKETFHLRLGNAGKGKVESQFRSAPESEEERKKGRLGRPRPVGVQRVSGRDAFQQGVHDHQSPEGEEAIAQFGNPFEVLECLFPGVLDIEMRSLL
jgi:hypothetical protein